MQGWMEGMTTHPYQLGPVLCPFEKLSLLALFARLRPQQQLTLPRYSFACLPRLSISYILSMKLSILFRCNLLRGV